MDKRLIAIIGAIALGLLLLGRKKLLPSGIIGKIMGLTYQGKSVLDMIKRHARNSNILPSQMVAVIAQESGGKINAYRYEPAFYDRYIKDKEEWKKSPYYKKPKVISASYGLMQLMVPTAIREGFSITSNPEVLYNPNVNLKYGARHLRRLLSQYGNSFEKALQAYNTGKTAEYWSSVGYPTQAARAKKYSDSVMGHYSMAKAMV